MNRLSVLLSTLLALYGCDAYIDRSEYQARLQVANYSGWLHARVEQGHNQIRQIGVVRTGHLREGDEATIPLDVTGAHRAVVIAACDKRCSDLDLRVVTEDGRLIGVDDEEDDQPQVYIDEKKANKLFLKVRMPSCEGSSCAYAIEQLQYEDFVGGFGTCFAVAPNGLLMTAFHVVDGASKIKVRFPDGRKGDAQVVRSSEDNDLALLRTNLATPDWLPLSPTRDVDIGTPAFTVGFPSPQMLGSELKLTEGSVSSLAGVEDSTMLQISIPIQGGNSGGPVVDHQGTVLGIVESVIDKDDNGTPMQLTNFARHARVASLLIPQGAVTHHSRPTMSRQQAIARATKSVCQVETE
jgi:S1-C subfamily serine protease